MRLPTEAQPESRIKIDGQMSDLHVGRTEEDESRIAHQMFGHISHRKMAATSAVVDSFPKYSKHATWCTSCHKGKMAHLPHAHDLWKERAAHAHDVWHIDLIGKFATPSLGGNQYVVTIIDNYSRYNMAIPIKTKTSESVLEALKKCIQDLQATPKKVYTDFGSEFEGVFKHYCVENKI